VTIAGTSSRIIGADRLGLRQLAGTMMPRARSRSGVRRRVKKLALERRNSPVDRTFAQARNVRQCIQGRGTKGDTRWRQ
jgi:hypothetical protein